MRNINEERDKWKCTGGETAGEITGETLTDYKVCSERPGRTERTGRGWIEVNVSTHDKTLWAVTLALR